MAHIHDPADTHEQRQSAYELEMRAKYTEAEVNVLGEKGHAFKNEDGQYSYPIDDLEDLRNAIHAVGRGNADHDAIRKYVIKMAGVLSATDEIPDNWNSDGSLKDDEAKSLRTPAQTRREERSIRAEYGTDRNVAEHRVAPRSQFELREVPNGTGGTNLKFTGFASVTCADHDDDTSAYEMEDWMGPWTESILSGAFKNTIDQNCDTAFLINHTGMTLARTKSGTMKLSEVTEPNASPIYGVTGLHTEAMLDPQNQLVQQIRSAVERGDLDEMSFAFRIMRQEWNDDWDRRWIGEVSLDKGDSSLVNYGANPHTGGTVDMRQKIGALGTRGGNADAGRVLAMVKRSKLLTATFEVREGKVLSGENASKLQEALDALHSTDDADIPGIVKALQAIDEALDAGQAAISAVLSVADPDGDAEDLEPELEPPNKQENSLYIPSYVRGKELAQLEAVRLPPRRVA